MFVRLASDRFQDIVDVANLGKGWIENQDMIDISTYNRLPELENKAPKRRLLVGAAVLVATGFAGLMAWLFAGAPLPIALGSIILLAGGFPLFLLAHRSRKICRLCGADLQEVVRPLQVNNMHLFSGGLVIGDAIFMPIDSGQGRTSGEWGKLYQWSLACHRCRVYESAYHEKAVPATPAELDKIRTIRKL